MYSMMMSKLSLFLSGVSRGSDLRGRGRWSVLTRYSKWSCSQRSKCKSRVNGCAMSSSSRTWGRAFGWARLIVIDRSSWSWSYSSEDVDDWRMWVMVEWWKRKKGVASKFVLLREQLAKVRQVMPRPRRGLPGVYKRSSGRDKSGEKCYSVEGDEE